jgi:hypothetical protein
LAYHDYFIEPPLFLIDVVLCQSFLFLFCFLKEEVETGVGCVELLETMISEGGEDQRRLGSSCAAQGAEDSPKH